MWPIVEFRMDSPVSGPFYSPQDAPDLASMYANGWPSSLPLGLSGAANGSHNPVKMYGWKTILTFWGG